MEATPLFLKVAVRVRWESKQRPEERVWLSPVPRSVSSSSLHTGVPPASSHAAWGRLEEMDAKRLASEMVVTAVIIIVLRTEQT